MLFSFLYVPIAVMIAFSFNENRSRGQFTGFTLGWYRQLFRNEMVLQALGLSLVLAFASAIVATLLGTTAAVGINRMRRGPRSLVMNATYIPIVNPEIITGVSMMLLFVVARNALQGMGAGWLAQSLIGLPSLLVAHVTFSVPYVIFNVVPKLRQMDVRLVEAALDLGCTPAQAFFKVVLPEIMPAVASSFLICLTYSIDDFTISYFTAGTQQTLPIAIYSMTRRKVSPEINALSTLIFVVIFTIIMVANYRERTAAKRRRRGPNYSRMGGFALFLVLTAALAGAVLLVAGLILLAGMAVAGFTLAGALLAVGGIATAVCLAVFVVLFVRRRPRFLWWYHVAIVVAALASGLTPAVLVATVLQLLLTGLYFARSVRVRTYMGGDEYLKAHPVMRFFCR